MKSPSRRTHALRFLAFLIVTLTLSWMLQSIPREGSVEGICRDRITHQPLAHAVVWLSKRDDDESSEAVKASQGSGPALRDFLGQITAPPGWNQQSSDDSTVDVDGQASGNQPFRMGRTAVTDASGHFHIYHVPVGEYQLTGHHGGYDDKDVDVFVAETDPRHPHPQQQILELSVSAPELYVDTPVHTWTPAEDPTLRIRGLLRGGRVWVTLWRADMDALLAQHPSFAADPDGDNYWSSGPPKWPGHSVLVRAWPVDVPGTNGIFNRRVHLGPLSPGLYRVRANAENVSDSTWLLVTRLAVVRKTYGDHLLAYVTDLSTGAAMPDVPVTLYEASPNHSRKLGEAVTSQNGLASLSTASASAESTGILVARRASSIAALSMDLNSPGSNADASDNDDSDAASPAKSPDPGAALGELRAFIYTDRPLYRPGDTVNLKGIARWYGGPSRGYAVVRNRPVTMVARDARDTVIGRLQATTNDMGSWTAVIPLSSEALTGGYTVRTEIDGRHTNGYFVVASYQKPEYEGDVTFDRPRYVRGQAIAATIHATYFFGMPVAGGTAKISVYRQETADDESSDGVGNYDQKLHTPPDDDNSAEESVSGDPILQETVNLDANGSVVLRIPTADQPDSEDDQSYEVRAEITDVGGQQIDATESANVAQGDYSLHTTVSPEVCRPGESVTAAIHATRFSGKPLAGQLLNVTGSFQTWNEDDEEVLTPVFHGSVTTDASGMAQIPVVPQHQGLLIVRATTADPEKRTVWSEASVWVTAADTDIPTRYPDLALILDRDEYTVGQTAHLLINTRLPGPTALVTVEGSTLYHYWTVPLRRRSTAFDLPILRDYAPDASLSVCIVQGKQFHSSSRKLQIGDQHQDLSIQVAVDRKVYRPGDAVHVAILTKDSSGPVPAEISVSVVDKALYALAPGAMKQPIGNTFLPGQQAGVGTGDSCEEVYLGDVDKGATDLDVRKKFLDTAYWAPTLRTGADGKASVTFRLPDNLTTWRVCCVGHTSDTRVGQGAGEFRVTRDLVVSLALPSFMVQGDRAQLQGVIHNGTGSPLSVRVTLDVSGLDLQGSPDQVITVPADRPVTVKWQATAVLTGPARLILRARAGSASDGVELPMPVEPHGEVRDVWQSGSTLQKARRTVTIDPAALPHSPSVVVRLSSTAASSLLPALDDLAIYPYGDTETTASALLSDLALRGAVVSGAIPLKPDRAARLQDQAQRSLIRLFHEQQDNGSWGWWRSGPADLWMSADAVWAAGIARDQGLVYDNKLFQKGVDALVALANQRRRERFPERDIAAFALTAQALAQAHDRASALDNLNFASSLWHDYPEEARITDLAALCLAAAMVEGDGSAQILSLRRELWLAHQDLGGLIAWPASPHRFERGRQQDPPDADATAWALLVLGQPRRRRQRVLPQQSLPPAGLGRLALNAPALTPEYLQLDPTRMDEIARWLLENRREDHWSAATTSSISLLALTGYLRQSHELTPDFSAAVLCNGQVIARVHFGADSVEDPETSIDAPTAALHPGKNVLEIHKEGTGRLYYTVRLRQTFYQPRPNPLPYWQHVIHRLIHPAPVSLPFSPSGVHIRRIPLRVTSRRGFFWEDTVPAPETDYHPGEGILVRLILDSSHPASHLIVEEPVPAGCRIGEVRGDAVQYWDKWWDYTDVRADRLVFYISDLPRGEHEIDYHLAASTPGLYDAMPTTLSSLFDPTYHATGAVSEVRITQ